MNKRPELCLLPGLLAVGLLLAPAAPGLAAQRLASPPAPTPHTPGHPPPASAAAQARSRPQPPPASPLPGQQFRNQKFRETDTYDPPRAVHDLHVGHFYLIQGDYAGALSRFKGAIRHDPHLTEALFEAGQAELKLHQPQAARQYFEKYLTVDPGGKRAHKIRSILKNLKKKYPRS